MVFATAEWADPFEDIEAAARAGGTFAQTAIFIGALALPVALLLPVVSLTIRFRRSTGDERLQLKWFVSAAEVTAVIGFERKPRKLGAANADVVLRLPLELPNGLEVEVPLDMRVACRSAVRVREMTIFSGWSEKDGRPC